MEDLVNIMQEDSQHLSGNSIVTQYCYNKSNKSGILKKSCQNTAKKIKDKITRNQHKSENCSPINKIQIRKSVDFNIKNNALLFANN